MISPKLFAILNITPDSFSDGGMYNNIDEAIKKTHQLIADGADIIDIGAESTRPGADILDYAQEWDRLKYILPKIIDIAKAANKLVSIDTYHTQTALRAIELGVDIINDVANLSEMQNIALTNNKKIVITHSLTVPADKNVIMPDGIDIIAHLISFFTRKIEYLESKGFNINNVILDPGIGFGKNATQSFTILKNINKLKELNYKILIGHSRKSLFNDFKNSLEIKDLKTHIASIFLAKQNIDYLRVHNIYETITAINFADQIGL